MTSNLPRGAAIGLMVNKYDLTTEDAQVLRSFALTNNINDLDLDLAAKAIATTAATHRRRDSLPYTDLDLTEISSECMIFPEEVATLDKLGRQHHFNAQQLRTYASGFYEGSVVLHARTRECDGCGSRMLKSRYRPRGEVSFQDVLDGQPAMAEQYRKRVAQKAEETRLKAAAKQYRKRVTQKAEEMGLKRAAEAAGDEKECEPASKRLCVEETSSTGVEDADALDGEGTVGVEAVGSAIQESSVKSGECTSVLEASDAAAKTLIPITKDEIEKIGGSEEESGNEARGETEKEAEGEKENEANGGASMAVEIPNECTEVAEAG